MQHRGQALPRALDEIVAALADRVPEQDRALRGVGGVRVPIAPQLHARRRIGRELADAVRVVRFLQLLGELLLRDLRAFLEKHRDFRGDILASCHLVADVHGNPFRIGVSVTQRRNRRRDHFVRSHIPRLYISRHRSETDAAAATPIYLFGGVPNRPPILWRRFSTMSAMTRAVPASPSAPTAFSRMW